MKVAVPHRCGGVAFWYERDQLRPYQPLRSEYAEAADGSPIAAGSLLACTSCGERISSLPRVEDILR